MMNSRAPSQPKIQPIGSFTRYGTTLRTPTPASSVTGHELDRHRSTSRRPQYQDSGVGSPHPVYDRRRVNETAKSLEVQDCLKQMIDFVKEHNLQPIVGGEGWSDEQLEVHLRRQAEIASQSPTKLRYVNRELMMQLAIMSLYDLAVLIDDSTSMEFEQGGERKKALKKVLHFLADLYSAVSDDMRGIKAIRFLNGTDDLTADHLRSKDEIDKVIDCHEFEGLTCIGAGLMRKVLKPFVFADEPWIRGTPRRLRRMERPLLVMVITDGEIDGEDPTWLEKAVKSAIDSLQMGGVGDKGVVFQFARVGNDADAEEFLRKLDDESSVAQYVDTLSGSDLIELMSLREADGEDYTENDQRKIIKLLLGPISPRYNNFVEITGRDLTDVAEDFD